MGDVSQVELPDDRRVSEPARYVFHLSAAPPAGFSSWFPHLQQIPGADGTIYVEGPVSDPCQLAGIVASICYRNGEILRFERLQIDE